MSSSPVLPDYVQEATLGLLHKDITRYLHVFITGDQLKQKGGWVLYQPPCSVLGRLHFSSHLLPRRNLSQQLCPIAGQSQWLQLVSELIEHFCLIWPPDEKLKQPWTLFLGPPTREENVKPHLLLKIASSLPQTISLTREPR